MLNENASKWQRELTEFLGVKSTFILEGNTADEYPTTHAFEKLDRAIEDIFSEKYDVLFCDPLFGFYSTSGYPQRQQGAETDQQGDIEEDPVLAEYKRVARKQRLDKTIVATNVDLNLTDERLAVFSEIIRAALTTKQASRTKPVACVINFASRSIANPAQLNANENIQFMNLLYASLNPASRQKMVHTLVLVVEKQNDLPAWFYLNNPNVRTITLPNPDRKMREAFIEEKAKNKFEIDVDEFAKMKRKFVDMTERMRLTEIKEVILMNENSGMAFGDISKNLAVFKYGVMENKWETELKDKFSDDKDIAAIIGRTVKGQANAVDKISQIIKRAITGLSGLQHSSGASKPRGIAFLAGPTGTGKTETVKAVTRLLFDDEKAMARFDMSEFSEAHSSQRLFGAPPGYVGYDNGGQLTNAIKANPFSVILFDEIEKAHFSIMDKFLQVLEDGRMTDGQGNTVYFSETIIFFTSNVGIVKKNVTTGEYEPNDRVKPGTEYGKLVEEVNSQIKLNFKPEFLNRIGRNIVVFDYIQDEIAADILASQLQTSAESLKNRETNKIILKGLDRDSEAFRFLLSECISTDTKTKGGRGIGNVVEDLLLNTLSDYIFDNNIADAEIDVYVAGGKLAFRKR